MTDEHKLAGVSGVAWRFKVLGGFKTVSAILVIAVVAMFFLWRPWQAVAQTSDRTISVTGTATLTATPDEYTFSPNYSFTGSDKQAQLASLTAKNDEIVAKLKVLGVADKDIKTNANGYGDYGYYLPVYNGDTYNLSLTVTIHTVALAQKVQDYLVTTSPSGSITPQVTFSTAKQQDLQSQARNKAEQNARAQADQSGKNLGFKIVGVKSVVDGSLGYPGGPIPYSDSLISGTGAADTKSELTVEPGQNDLSYSVQVVYFIR